MKIINIYEAVDGKRFNKEHECLLYEKIANQVIEFTNKLDMNAKIDGEGYIQHPIGTKEAVKTTLLRLSNHWFKENRDVLTYALGRYISDGEIKCLGRLMSIYQCIDTKERQWNQPYYANNPGTGKYTKLN